MPSSRKTLPALSDSISSRVSHTIQKAASKKLSAFTLAELIVVIAVLAVLATIGFLALSGYRQEAEDARAKANVRSVLTAISAESSVSSRSPRYFVKHDPDWALGASSVVVFDGVPAFLVPGPYGAPGTNYSAGNPDWAKLKLDPERFRVSFSAPASSLLRLLSSGLPVFPGFPDASAETSTTDASAVLVGAADLEDLSSGKPRSMRFVQTAGILSTSEAFVTGDYPAGMEGSVGGLVKDPEDPSGTWALVDGAKTGGPAPCPAAELSGYQIPDLTSGTSSQVSKPTANGTLSATASCSFGTASLSSESAFCESGYVPASGASGPYCVEDVCGGTPPGTGIPNAESNASSQSVSGNWNHSATPGLCTFACSAGFSWDGSACRADCAAPLSVTENGLPYALSYATPELRILTHSQTRTFTGTNAFGSAPENGTLSAEFLFSCSDGTPSVQNVTPLSGLCETNHTWNSDWTAPSCSADTRTANCDGTVPPNGTATTGPQYSQTYDGLAWAWLPEYSWALSQSDNAPACLYSCDTNYVPSGGSCVGASQVTSCTGLPQNALWNSVSSITQTWNGSAWAPISTGTYSATASTSECRFACTSNYTWNTVSCQADTKTFMCAAKPTTGTVWNSVDSYQQTWNGSAWAPADTSTAYSTTASTTACNYQCASGYGWDGSACQVTVNASCGTAHAAATYSYPTTNHCAQGTKADVDMVATDGGFDWTCAGAYGGTAATCSAPKKIDGVCGTANATTLTSAPSTNLCSVGTASTVTGTGPWNWSCSGTNSGNPASCSASIASYTVTFNANGGGTPSPTTKSVTHGTAVWTLATVSRTGYAFNGWFTLASGGTQITTATTVTAAVTYYAQWVQNPACGSANALATVAVPTANLCSIGTASAVTTNVGTYTWTCSAAPATAASCSAPRQYTVTWNGNLGTPSVASTNVTYNVAIGTLPTATRTGYAFNGWFTATSGGTQITTATVVTAAVTYYAQWTQLVYTVSGSFGVGANGATVSVCGTTVTAAADGSFSRTGIPHGTACNAIAATRTNYTCTTSTNGPASLTTNVTNVAGSCLANTQLASCTGLPQNALWNSVSSITQTWNGSAWAPISTGTYSATASTSECRFACTSNYTWNTVSCQADTKTFMCAAKPATGTVWNSVDSYQQTWNGTAWAPADTSTAYSTTASTAACRYQCASGYGWDGSACQVTVNASCGTAHTTATYSYPTTNHCAQGTKSDVDTNGNDGGFDWTCAGAYGGTAATCSAPKKIDGVCGTANATTLTSAPSTNLCSVGTASTVTGTGPWNWSCSGTNSGNPASCSASIASHTVTFDGNGGSGHSPATKSVTHGAQVGAFPSNPTRSGYAFNGWFTLASGGTQITTTTTVTAAVTYHAQWVQNPACGSANALATVAVPTANLCSVGTASAVTTNVGTYTWTCSAAPATAASCSAPRQYTVTWNGNSGTPSVASTNVTYNAAVGTLPTATRTGYAFNGWFTATSGGTQVTTDAVVTAAVTWYARWTALWTCWTSTVTAGGYTYTTKLGPDGKCWTSTNMKHTPSAGNRWTYGSEILYDWTAATSTLCSQLWTGWALPTDAQWTALTSAWATGWTGNKLEGIVSSLPGYRNPDGSFYYQGTFGCWWSSTQSAASSAWYRYLTSGNAAVDASYDAKALGFSVVCLKN